MKYLVDNIVCIYGNDYAGKFYIHVGVFQHTPRWIHFHARFTNWADALQMITFLAPRKVMISESSINKGEIKAA